MKRTLLALVATISLAGAAMLGASPALASNYSGNCAGVTSFNGTGNVNITDTACTLPQSITATGYIHISATSISGSGHNLNAGDDVSLTASGGAITIGTLTSGSSDNITISATGNVTTSTLTSSSNIDVETSGGAISTGNITSRTAGGSALGNILLKATGNVGTGNINTNGAAQAADVEIFANSSAGGSTFNVGGGGANGTGTINASVTSGGGSSPSFWVVIDNGAGGINVNPMTTINVSASSSEAGIIVLNAHSNTITLVNGTLSADGSTGKQAGNIFLLASTVTAADGAVLTASQGSSAAGSSHQVVIAATTINTAGSTGLTIHADGNGQSGNPSFNLIGPPGSATVSTSGPINGRSIDVTFSSTDAAVTVNASSGAGPLTITANGDSTSVVISARPITFNNTGTLTITTNGDSSNSIQINDPVVDGTTVGLTFTGNVVLSANGVSGVGDSGGGQVGINSVDGLPTPGGTVTITADAAGSGNGGNITIAPYNDTVSIGNAVAGTFTLSAKGGSSGGNGGLINLNVWNGVTLDASAVTSSISLNALGGNGKGGELDIESCGGVTNNTSGITLDANGIGSGTGGTFNWQMYCNAVPFQMVGSPAVPNLHLVATGGASGPGGTVTVSSATNDGTNPIDVKTFITVDAGSSSSVTVQDGSIALNGVTCGQWKVGTGTGNTSWLKTYWACASPTSPDTIEQGARTGATSVGAVKSVFDTNGVNLFVFASPADYNTFIAASLAGSGNFGWTATFGSTVYSSVFETSTNGTLTVDNAKEIAAHELGHAVASLEGDETGGQAWTTWAENDLLTLDYTTVGTSDATSTRRAACSGGGTAPFDGVVAESDGNPICSSGVLANEYRVGGVSTGAPLINSKIAQIASGIFVWSSSGHWTEMYAQAFSYQSVAFGLSPNFAYKTADGLFGKSNTLECVQDWGESRNNNTTPSLAGCSATVPGWYHTQVTTQ